MLVLLQAHVVSSPSKKMSSTADVVTWHRSLFFHPPPSISLANNLRAYKPLACAFNRSIFTSTVPLCQMPSPTVAHQIEIDQSSSPELPLYIVLIIFIWFAVSSSCICFSQHLWNLKILLIWPTWQHMITYCFYYHINKHHENVHAFTGVQTRAQGHLIWLYRGTHGLKSNEPKRANRPFWQIDLPNSPNSYLPSHDLHSSLKSD